MRFWILDFKITVIRLFAQDLTNNAPQ